MTNDGLHGAWDARTECPFCGGNEIGQAWDDHLPQMTCVVCCDCGARGPDKEEWSDAVEAWDKRYKRGPGNEQTI